MKIKIGLLFALAAISMFAPAIANQFASIKSEEDLFSIRPHAAMLMMCLPLACTGLWVLLFIEVYKKTATHKKAVFWLLLLVPFVLCLPAWAVIVIVECVALPSFCKGPMP